MSDNRGTGQGRDPSRPILDEETPGDAYENEEMILDRLDDRNDLGGPDDLDEDSDDLEDFDELEDDDSAEGFGDEDLDDEDFGEDEDEL